MDIQKSDEYAFGSERAFVRAKEMGWDVILPSETEIFIDIDSAEDYKKFKDLFPVFQGFRPNSVIVRETESPSGKLDHRHIVLDTKVPVSSVERVLLQAVLGSDRKRELLAWNLLEREDKNPTLFFEKNRRL